MKRTLGISMAFAISVALHAQVVVDGPVQLTGTPGDATVEGLSWPTEDEAAVTVRASVINGGFAWCEATLDSDTLRLTADPAITAYRDGLLLRFLAPFNMHGPLHVQGSAGLSPLPLLRPDGLVPTLGQIRQGTICEVMQVDGRFVLMNAPERGCPQGSVPVTEMFCMQQTPVTGVLFHDAVQYCADLGGRLCAWDEYIAGCTLAGTELIGMFQNWEWLDESSDHTHGADQAGLSSCISHQMMGNLATQVANARCCFHPR